MNLSQINFPFLPCLCPLFETPSKPHLHSKAVAYVGSKAVIINMWCQSLGVWCQPNIKFISRVPDIPKQKLLTDGQTDIGKVIISLCD